MVTKYPASFAAAVSVTCELEVAHIVSQEPAQNASKPIEKAIVAINV